MSYTEAHIILDMLRDGYEIEPATINTALELTGDLEHVACSLAEAV